MKIRNIDGTVIKTVKGSSLVGANLSESDLHGANFSGAHLAGTGLTKADLRAWDAVFDETTVF